MTQPLQTRRFKEALARVRHLFMETRGTTLTTADAALMAGLTGRCARGCFGTSSRRAFLSSAPGASSRAPRRRRRKARGFSPAVVVVTDSSPQGNGAAMF
jgi:hypothetical protein